MKKDYWTVLDRSKPFYIQDLGDNEIIPAGICQIAPQIYKLICVTQQSDEFPSKYYYYNRVLEAIIPKELKYCEELEEFYQEETGIKVRIIQ